MIKNFYDNHVPFSDRIFVLFLILAALIGSIFFLINHLVTHYQGWDYAPPLVWIKTIATLFVWTAGLYIMKFAPRIGFTARTVAIGQLMYCAAGVLAFGVQFTPFPLIDKFLMRSDQWFHINTAALLILTHRFPSIRHLFKLSYQSMEWQFLFLPIILAILLEKHAVNELLLNIFLSFMIGTVIYYFLPANGPLSYINSLYFSQEERDVIIRFYEVHHHLSITTGLGGLTTFPSFHVIWLTQLTYAAYCRKWLFFPLIVINTIAIFSTLFLGWHYLIDIIGGFILVGITLFLVKRIYRDKKDE